MEVKPMDIPVYEIPIYVVVVTAALLLYGGYAIIGFYGALNAKDKEIIKLTRQSEDLKTTDTAKAGLIKQLKADKAELMTKANRLPKNKYVRHVNTPIGPFAIETNFLGRIGTNVWFPQGFGYSSEIAEALSGVTDGKYRMQPAREVEGADVTADAFIAPFLSEDRHKDTVVEVNYMLKLLSEIIIRDGSLTDHYVTAEVIS